MSVPHPFAGQASPVNADKLDSNNAYLISLLPWVNAKDFGAVGDGVADDTAAINLALQSTTAFGSVIKRNVFLPPGDYKITGTLYVRAGCGLLGAGSTATRVVASGMASSDRMVRMGWGVISGTPTVDGSGLCPIVQGIFFNGTGTAVSTIGQAGWKIIDIWVSCSVGIEAGGADGVIDRLVVDTATPVGIVFSGQRITVSAPIFANPNYGIQFNPVDAGLLPAKVTDITISHGLFFACSYASAHQYTTSVVGVVRFVSCDFMTSIFAGVRQANQRHFTTQAGAQFDLYEFESCHMFGAKGNSIELLGGTGTLRIIGGSTSKTGVADDANNTPTTYALAHSIVVSSAARLIVRAHDFIDCGGQSIRLGHASAKARISDVHNINCGTGGSGLVAEANIGDRAHIAIRDGATDVIVRDCDTDSTALYVVGSHNFGAYSSSGNKSKSTSYDTHSSTAAGTHFCERHDGSMTPTVASAATLTLPHEGAESPTHIVSGTTNVTSITTTGWAGRKGTLVFSGALTLTDGGNIKAVGNFLTAANSTWSWTCDGTNFYETGRSLN